MERRPRTPKKDVEEPSVVIESSEHLAQDTEEMTTRPLGMQPKQCRPENPRSRTDPSPTIRLQSSGDKDTEVHDRPSSSGGSSRNNKQRNKSPYSRSHLRSRSTGTSSLTAPLMARAHSLPNPHTPQPFSALQTPLSSGSLSPSPLRSPARARSPFRVEEGGLYAPPPRSPSWYDMSTMGGYGTGIEAIQEDSELDFTPRSQPLPQSTSASSLFSRHASLHSSRRPASPLHGHGSTQSLPPSFPASVIDSGAVINMSRSASNPGSSSSSPALNAQKYNESYPTSFSLHHYASNSSFSSFSMPSTPTSARSRSPSISSLETIEDAPEEETEAEAEVIERLKHLADSESDGESEGPRRKSLDVPRASGRRIGLGIAGERKRWSICGGERRADLDLETIWED